MINSAFLLSDLNSYSYQEIIETENLILEEQPQTMESAIKLIGYSKYRLALLAVHFLVHKKLIDSISPYDKEAPELDEHTLCFKINTDHKT